jgi:hypothetical protein
MAVCICFIVSNTRLNKSSRAAGEGGFVGLRDTGTVTGDRKRVDRRFLIMSTSYGCQPASCAISTQMAFATRILPADTLPRWPPSTSVV